MANRVLLLLALASRNHPSSSSKILRETAGTRRILYPFAYFSCSFIYYCLVQSQFY